MDAQAYFTRLATTIKHLRTTAADTAGEVATWTALEQTQSLAEVMLLANALAHAEAAAATIAGHLRVRARQRRKDGLQ